ncbi:MAG: 4Fe-4S binding protein [Clostridia bacterium]|nr:4Fe-4S binding protein [Clostridia bacterium]
MPSRRIVLRFNASIVDKPVIYRLVKDYDLVFNILKANVTPQMEGTLVMELSGERFQEGLDYLANSGVTIEPLGEQIVRNAEKCVSCGACTAICPTGALSLERPSMQVEFKDELCVVCQLCTRACPLKAMEVRFS